MTADNVEVGADFPRLGDLVFGTELETEVRNAGEVIARNHENVAISVSEWIERRLQGQGVLKGGIDVRVVRIDIPAILLVVHVGLDFLAQCVTGILEKLMARNWA